MNVANRTNDRFEDYDELSVALGISGIDTNPGDAFRDLGNLLYKLISFSLIECGQHCGAMTTLFLKDLS